jgi:hypothetical protein
MMKAKNAPIAKVPSPQAWRIVSMTTFTSTIPSSTVASSGGSAPMRDTTVPASTPSVM